MNPTENAPTIYGESDSIWFRETIERVRTEVAKQIVGQSEAVELTLVCLAANGNILLEGMPGLGKTLLVKTLSEVLQIEFARIQFTPDLMPADITGTNVLMHGEDGERGLVFRPGPIFTNLLLADEINRATPKTQSALLEAMQEKSVTVSGHRRNLAEPFLVMATQNPVEQEGTYPLPEAQLDRFFFKVLIPQPNEQELAEVVRRTTSSKAASIEPVATGADVLKLRSIAKEVPISDDVLNFGVRLVTATHCGTSSAAPIANRYLRFGASPRAAQAIVTAGKIFALLDGRFNVAKEDLIKAALPALRHRIAINFEAEADGKTADAILTEVIQFVSSSDRDPVRI